jgi:hypothetical protein
MKVAGQCRRDAGFSVVGNGDLEPIPLHVGLEHVEQFDVVVHQKNFWCRHSLARVQ